MKEEVQLPPRPLTLARLRALTAVAEEGSFAAAARRLGLSHSAVAQQVRELQAAYQVHLFDRVQGALQPTALCAELCDIGVGIQEAEREAVRLLERRTMSGGSKLRVGLGNSMPGIAIIGTMLQRHPTLSVTVQTGSHRDIMAALLRRDVDVAMLPDIPADRRFRSEPVLTQEVVAIVAAASPLAERSEVSLAELASQPLIFRSQGSSTQRMVDRALLRAALAPEPRLVADTRDAVYEAVALGIGAGFMWRHSTYRSDTVRRIPIADMQSAVSETIFSLADDATPLINLFFSAAREYVSLT
ncbi:LysR substrate-binding domain-containing protein [Palleronia sp.]|uniref:LysR family transcriptional regulator n=1 Tax=Palleronia sp. TaxID=1940284 RepID=UPI0035C81AB2